MLKNKIFSYLFVEFFKAFFLIFFLFSILLWFIQAARLLDLITEYGNSITIYLKFVILGFPKTTEKLVLLSFFLTIFFFYSKLKEDNELNIFLFSGISELKIIKINLLIAGAIFIFYAILTIYVSPLSSSNGRAILSKSKFTLINSLVKEKNFNSPLKEVTIYVNSNNQKGELKGIFIYEKNRTIISKSGRVITDGDNTYLEISDGKILEKTENNFNTITFEKTTYDFSKFATLNVTYSKFSERSIFWLFENLTKKTFDKKRTRDLREEINKRIIKPFFIFVICLLGSFFLYDNKKNKSFFYRNFKIIIFFIGIVLLILNEIMLGMSGNGSLATIFYFLTILTIIFIEYLMLLFLFKKK